VVSESLSLVSEGKKALDRVMHFSDVVLYAPGNIVGCQASVT
jgi:hypothetical protein